MKIGIIGMGVVGNANATGFRLLEHEVFEHDIKFDTEISPLTNEINHFIGYFNEPSKCITGYHHTKNVIKVIEEYYQ